MSAGRWWAGHPYFHPYLWPTLLYIHTCAGECKHSYLTYRSPWLWGAFGLLVYLTRGIPTAAFFRAKKSPNFFLWEWVWWDWFWRECILGSAGGSFPSPRIIPHVSNGSLVGAFLPQTLILPDHPQRVIIKWAAKLMRDLQRYSMCRDYCRRWGIRTSKCYKCKGLILPYLADMSDVKIVWDICRNKTKNFRRQFLLFLQ